MITEELERLILLMRWEERFGDSYAADWYRKAALQEAMNVLGLKWPSENEIQAARE